MYEIQSPITWQVQETPASREKGRDLTQSYGKSPYILRKIQKAKWKHKNATKNFNYTTIADRLRTVSWSDDINLTGNIRTHASPRLDRVMCLEE